ncbi:alpha-L-fucosidase [Rathayibacter sp. VKM Ac-2856]|uniref:glycosyl hydrolase family 95 catalytic domain-containing protein n=1 Tax=unclassified Rathayibacter TaxID=2609250 RepID=UPI001565F3D9|nr:MULTISPECIES: alpha-L-fucosidase [unclassified Rathayibacter]NQX03524.1 alpha-L-fucosidase [Rathayibacter sp. VKM Ac-2858]NQX18692.1 alpha-L-fucosidase [Rathayibacter sp. VKM Ac-2856]
MSTAMSTADVSRGFHGRTEATVWETGLMVGTGSTGAALYEGGERDGGAVVSLSHERLRLPVDPLIGPPLLAPLLPGLRALLAQPPVSDADAERIEQWHLRAWAEEGHDGGLLDADPLVPAGVLRLALATDVPADDPAGVPEHSAGVRERSVDYTTGTAALTLPSGLTVTVRADRAADRLLVAVRADAPFSGLLLLAPADEPTEPDLGPDAPRDHREHALVRPVDGGETLALETVPRHPRPTGLRSALVTARLLRGDESVVLDRGAPRPAWRVSGARELELELRVAVTSAEPVPAAPPVLARFARAMTPHDQLVDACAFSLGAATPRSIEEVRADPGSADELIERAFAAGRHAIIAATGELPASLQGVWAGSWAPAWSSDYTLNGNVQNGGIASLGTTGTPELLRSFFTAVAEFEDDYRLNAERILGAPGFLLPTRISGHGRANHFTAEYPLQYWLGGGGWILRIAWDHWSSTGDEEFLRDWARPFAREVVACYRHALVIDEDGTAHVSPGYSPENHPGDQGTPIARDATSELAMIRDALLIAARIERLLGPEDDRLARECADLAARLPPYRVAPDGQLAEWRDPALTDRPEHRHASHLYPWWYEGDPAAADPALGAAALESVRARLRWRAEDPTAPPGRMEMAFGLVQAGVAAATLGDAEAALQCVDWLARLHWRPNMMPTHDADAILNVDAAGGLPALVAQMLARSDGTALHLLPALPARWTIGRISGLHLRGALRIESLAWTAETIECVLRSPAEAAAARLSERVEVCLPSDVELQEPAAGALQVGPRRLSVDLRDGAPLRLVLRRL